MKRRRIFLDDARPTPEGWVRASWPAEVIAWLETGTVQAVSLDHDLGDDARGTGYDVICWIEEAVAQRGFDPPIITVHSANPARRRGFGSPCRETTTPRTCCAPASTSYHGFNRWRLERDNRPTMPFIR